MPDHHDHRCIVDRLESEGLSHAEAMAEVRRKQAELIAKHGWVSHYIPDDRDSPTGFNCHTHSVMESFGHPDFQIVLPLDFDVAHAVMSNLIEAIKAGRRFAAGDLADGIIRGYELGFAAATEGGRTVLRIILPDPEGRTGRVEIGEAYAVQYEGTN